MTKKIIYFSLIFISLSFFNVTAKQPPPGSGITDVKSNILIVLATTNTMSGNMAIPVIDFRAVNDSEPDSLEGNIHSINWSGGHVTLHTYLGAAILDYGKDEGWSGFGAKIAADACNNMYGKNGGRILKFTTNPCSGSSFTWQRQERIDMSASDGAINCGTMNDDSGLAVYERKGEIYITDRRTHNTCIFNLERVFLRSFNTQTRTDGLGGSSQSTKANHSIAIDQSRGLLYYWQSDERKLYVDFIDHEITDPNTNPSWATVSDQLSTEHVCPGRGNAIDCVTDIALDDRGDVYLADRTNGRIVKFTGYSKHSGHSQDGLKYIDKLKCNWPSHGGDLWRNVYAFGIDDTTEPNVAWGASYARNKVCYW